MKTTILTLLGVLLCGSVSAQQIDPQVITCHQGEVIERIVLMNHGFDVTIQQGTPTGIRLEIAPGVSPDTMQYTLQDGTLLLGFKNTVIDTGDPKIKHVSDLPKDHNLPRSKAIVTVGDLQTLTNNGGANLRFSGELDVTKISILHNGSADLFDLNVKASEQVSLFSRGSGTVYAEIRQTPNVSLGLDASGKIEATVDSVRMLSLYNGSRGEIVICGRADSMTSYNRGEGSISVDKLKVARKTTQEQQPYDYKMKVFPFYSADVLDVKSGKSYQIKVVRLLSGSTNISGDGDDVQMAFRELLVRLSSPTDTKEVRIKNGEVIKKDGLLEIKNAEGEVLYRQEGK